MTSIKYYERLAIYAIIKKSELLILDCLQSSTVSTPESTKIINPIRLEARVPGKSINLGTLHALEVATG